MDPEHCSSWTLTRLEEEINEDGSETATYWTKELNPKHYQQEIDPTNYYNQFDDYVLSETVTETITDEEGNEISEVITYTANGSREVSTTRSAYDEFGNRISQTETVQATERGKAKNKSEVQTSFTYDCDGNVIETEEKSRKDTDQPWTVSVTKAAYDDHGRIVERYDPRGVQEGYAAKYEYDICGQLIKERIPVDKKNGVVLYQTNTMEYDEEGNIIAEESQQSDNTVQRTEYTYDIMGQLVQVKDVQDQNSAVYAQYMYDREGNKICQYTGLTKPLTLRLKEGEGDNRYTYMGHTYCVEIEGKAKKDVYSETKYNYNKKDELISYIDPEGNEERYTYDVYGNLVTVIDRNGNTITQHYDYQNRMTAEEAEDKETKKKAGHTYEYDVYGNTSKVDNREFEYDDISGQVPTETVKGETKKTIKKSYQYDSDGVTTRFAIKVGDKTQLALAYEYDGESKLQTVRQTDGGTDRLVASYEYDANGALIRENGRKIRTDYRYNVGGTLSQMVNHSGDGVLLSRYDADYQKNGQKTKETEEVRGTDGITEKSSSGYKYDCLGRLTKETHTGTGEINYTYDAHNNRKEMTTEDQIISYKYNKNDELLRTDTLNRKTERDDVTLYRQDANGNQLATIKRKKIDRTKKGPQFDLNVTLGANRLNENVVNHYNAWNQNTETLTKNYKVQYTYDDEGLRSSKTVNGKKTVYVWDGGRLVMELDAKGNVKRRYIWGQNLACTDTGMGTDTQYYVLDPHGSVVQLVNDDGSIARRYRYDAFGNETKPDQKDDNPFRYCGEYYNKETDTLYLRAREYDAGTGRFLTADTYTGEAEDIGSLNLYTYCYNDSVNMVDPTGHWGRHREKGIEDKVFTHRFMTEQAYPVTMAAAVTEAVAKMKFQSLKSWQHSKILDGTILPDFVRSGSPGIYQSVYGDKKGVIYKRYKKYKTKKLMGYYLKVSKKKEKKTAPYLTDEVVNNIFHGKSYKNVEYLKDEAKIKFATADKGKKDIEEKSLFFGCVLHSLQDYYAHSDVSDLQNFKATEGKGASGKERAFHKDWADYFEGMEKVDKKYKKGKLNLRDYNKKKKELDAEREIIHSDTKDNPYSKFRRNKKGEWSWKIKYGGKKDKRYKKAYSDTIKCMRDIFMTI